MESRINPRKSPQPMNAQKVGTLNAYIFVLEEYKNAHYLRIYASDGPIFIKMVPRKILEYSYDAVSWHRIPQFRRNTTTSKTF